MLHPVSGNQRWKSKYETCAVTSNNLVIRGKPVSRVKEVEELSVEERSASVSESHWGGLLKGAPLGREWFSDYGRGLGSGTAAILGSG